MIRLPIQLTGQRKECIRLVLKSKFKTIALPAVWTIRPGRVSLQYHSVVGLVSMNFILVCLSSAPLKFVVTKCYTYYISIFTKYPSHRCYGRELSGIQTCYVKLYYNVLKSMHIRNECPKVRAVHSSQLNVKRTYILLKVLEYKTCPFNTLFPTPDAIRVCCILVLRIFYQFFY